MWEYECLEEIPHFAWLDDMPEMVTVRYVDGAVVDLEPGHLDSTAGDPQSWRNDQSERAAQLKEQYENPLPPPKPQPQPAASDSAAARSTGGELTGKGKGARRRGST